MLLRRPTLLATTVACALLALPAIASAKDYCSGFPGCTGTYVDDGEVSSALTQAESNGSDDRIFLGPGVYIFGPFGYQSSERIEIIGAGAGQTVLQGDAAGARRAAAAMR